MTVKEEELTSTVTPMDTAKISRPKSSKLMLKIALIIVILLLVLIVAAFFMGVITIDDSNAIHFNLKSIISR